MVKLKNFFGGTLAVLVVLLLTGCSETDNPVRTSIDVNTSPLVLSIGGSATRAASSNVSDAVITYTSSKPAVATVDKNGTVKGLSEGEATITISVGETIKSYRVIVNKVPAVVLKDVDKATPLTLVAAENGKITVYFKNGITLANDIKYTINGGTEQTISKNTEGSYDIVVSKGDVVQLYSTNTSLGGGGGGAAARAVTRSADDGAKYINIRPSMKTEIYGNVMSLLKGKDNLEDATEIEGKNAFYGLFDGADKLVNSEDRELVLPATTLKEGCYDNMFSGCKGIEKAPELPAPTLEPDCYKGMFAGCSKLSSVKCLATDLSAEGSTTGWLQDAGTEAETQPVIETAKEANWNAVPDAIPDNFQQIIAVNKITLEPTTLKLMAGDTAPLTATIEPADATNKELQWSSTNVGVARVNSDGLVTAIAAGTTTIVVSTLDGSVAASCEVTVEALPDVPTYYKVYIYGEDPSAEPSFKPASWDAAAMRFSNTEGKYFRTLTDDEYFSLKTLIFDVSDVSDDIRVRVMNGWWSNTYYDNIIWEPGLNKIKITETMAEECAKGGGERDLDLMLTRGSCTIKAVYYEVGGEDEPQIFAQSISVTPTATLYYDSDLGSGTTTQLEASVLPENTTKKLVGWETSDSKVVEVDQDGTIRASGIGEAKVTARTGDGSNLSATCVVTVKPVGGISYEIKELEKYPDSQPFINPLTIVGEGVTSVTYTSSDESIATVNASTGEVTISSGTTSGQSVVITATATVTEDDDYIYPESKRTASYTVNIKNPTGKGEREDYSPGSW